MISLVQLILPNFTFDLCFAQAFHFLRMRKLNVVGGTANNVDFAFHFIM